jgi:hypothetical protein
MSAVRQTLVVVDGRVSDEKLAELLASRPNSPSSTSTHTVRCHGVQPSHAPPAFIPPNQNAAAMNGSGTTHSGFCLIQKQPSPNSTSQTVMKIPTAQPGAIKPEARKKGERASIAAKANTPATYFPPVRASRGMAASSHVRAALSGASRTGPMSEATASPSGEL